MKKYNAYWIAILLITGLFSCSDFLEKEYDLSVSEEAVFSNTTLTRNFLTNIYTNLPDGVGIYGDNQFLGASRDCMTDNAVSFWSLHYYSSIARDSYTAVDHPLAGSFWSGNFAGIRKCNQFLRNIREGVISNKVISGDDNKLYERYRAEAILLRAMFHMELVAYFGDAPIMCDREAAAGINPVSDEDFGIVLDMEDQGGMNLYRANATEVLEWVAEQCDYVKDVLPFRYQADGNWGRVNGATAYALKSRALLYRASPLHNEGNDKSLWTKAAQAAQDFINKNKTIEQPYELYSDYQKCFYETPYTNREVILSRSVWVTNVVETNLLPIGFGTGGRTNPTQNLVDSYEMTNGLFIDDANSGYDPQNPYANRDARLAATIFRHGENWGRADKQEERTLDMTVGGADYRGDQGGTYTGYYLKKSVNPSYIVQERNTSEHAWIIYRYAEILLNYAEALNEANSGPTTEAYNAINEVRNRVGMPSVSGLNYDSFRKRVRNERRVEFAFEDQRYFDLRRWRAYEDQNVTSEVTKPRYQQIYNLYSIVVAEDGGNTTFRGTALDDNYKDQNVPTHVVNIPKNYFFPIPNKEVKKAPNLGQNQGW